MENICKYCNKKFVSLSTLNKHIKTTPAYCLKIQKKILTSGSIQPNVLIPVSSESSHTKITLEDYKVCQNYKKLYEELSISHQNLETQMLEITKMLNGVIIQTVTPRKNLKRKRVFKKFPDT